MLVCWSAKLGVNGGITGASRNTLKQHFRTLVECGTLNRHGGGRAYDMNFVAERLSERV